MRKLKYVFAVMVFLALGYQSIATSGNPPTGLVWNELEKQLGILDQSVKKIMPENRTKNQGIAPRALENKELKLVPATDWCSGFFAGCLWLMYEHTNDEKWKSEAEKFTELLTDQQWNLRTHDMGFKMYSSFGNGFRLINNNSYRETLIQSAKTLITRYNEKVGCLRSWDHNQDKWQFPVIIDNMMNLELLFWATRETGDSVYYKIAVTHALTTMKNHFRPDYSCYHVIGYDPETGKVLQRNTHQGYSDESAWSRGQAWALYGYTMVYRETLNPVFLEQAKHIANFLFSNRNMPADLIPYWDFDAPGIPNEPRDVSAAAVIASALLCLKNFVPEKAAEYQVKASLILKQLTKNYRSEPGSNQGFLLDHSTGSKPHGSEVDVPLIYADYYYLEALSRNEIFQH
ncbi:MAG: glycoside hydrolase family 88 protein [Prolixibacteraceae bacterium]|nr:glycoside hydrolase family 88 protein [Prolixibacteraceae bacterium]